jgi:predicted secreted protein
MSDALIGYGTRLYMGATANAAALTKLAEVTSVSFPDETVAEVEVTHYESPGRAREFIPGLSDNGSITFAINWVPGSATDDMLIAAKADRANRTFRIVTPGDEGQMFTFPAFISGLSRAAPMDDRMTAEVTLRVAGAVTIAEASENPTVIA